MTNGGFFTPILHKMRAIAREFSVPISVKFGKMIELAERTLKSPPPMAPILYKIRKVEISKAAK